MPRTRPLRPQRGPAQCSFTSGSTTCAATHYRGSNGACVVMASGLGVTRGPGTAAFAARFHAEGYSVVAFDYRRFGDSGGEPRQVVRIAEQLEDWNRAADFALELPDIDRVALWGFSLGGGHVIRAAAGRRDLAAAIAQAPTADGLAAARNATRHSRPGALLRLSALAIADAVAGLAGAKPLLVPAAGPPGSTAMLTTPDALDAQAALDPRGDHPEWDPRVAARFALTSGTYRPVQDADRVRCPLLVVAYQDDRSALAAPAEEAAERAPHGQLALRPGGHYAGFLDDLEDTFTIESAFLRQHLLHDRAA